MDDRLRPDAERHTGEPVPPMDRPYKIDFNDTFEASSPPAPPQQAEPETPAGPQKHWVLVAFEGAPGTMLIIAANLLVFIAMVLTSFDAFLSPSPLMRFQWGSNYGPETLTGQWWRIWTSNYVHAGILHLAINMYALSDVGRALERLLGTSKFVVIYTLAGLGGSIVTLLVMPNVNTVGASGAVFGAFGAFLTLIRMHKASFNEEWVQGVTRTLAMLLVFNLLWGFSNPAINNAAHIGGFITGAAAGWAALPKDIRERKWSRQNVAWTILLTLILGTGGYAAHLLFINATH
jgi:rhomboid protease GluP